MPADIQELTTQVFISSFLDDSLQGYREYRQLFTDPLIRQYWLPETICRIQYMDGTTMIISDYEEDMDITTLTIKGGKAFGENLINWREEPAEMGSGRLRDSASVYLKWDYERKGEATYTLFLPESATETLSVTSFTFTVANVSQSHENIDFKIVIKDQAGEDALLPLSHIATLSPSPQYQMFKKPLGVSFLSEPVFTTYNFLLSDFSEVNPAFNPQAIAEICFLFNETSGAFYLDDIGLN